MSKFGEIFSLGVFVCSWFQASASIRPGAVLEDTFPQFEKQGVIHAAAEAPDGGFFVLGDFTAVDGIARPGLAKLDANGRLDQRFRPLMRPDVVMPTTLAPQHPREQYGEYWLNPRRSEQILPLSNGGLIIKGDARWEVRDLDGRLNVAGFAGLEKEGQNRAKPLFDQDGRIFMRVSVEGRVRVQAYRSSDFLPDPNFQLEDRISMVFPGEEGFLWGGFQTEDENGDPQQFLVRLFPDGTIDPDFVPVPYPFAYDVESAGPEIKSTAPARPFYSSKNIFEPYRPSAQNVRVSLFIPTTNDLWSFGYEVPFGGYAGVSDADADLGLIALDYSLNHLYRETQFGKVEGFRIPLADPEYDGETATDVFSVLITRENEILVGGNRMFDGAGDPVEGWHVARFSRGATLRGFHQRRNGEVLIFGDFDRIDGQARRGLASISQDGRINEDFRIDRDWRFVKQVTERDDGSLIILSERGLRDPNDRDLPRLA